MQSQSILHYYGARYYTPELMALSASGGWMSVDPLTHQFPHLTPYNFTENNPIMLWDPTGMGPDDPENKPLKTTNIIISGTVDENNTTHVIQTIVESTMQQQDDGTICISEIITETINQVRNSDGQVTYGDVITYSRVGERDKYGNITFSLMKKIKQRSQNENEFTNLQSWTKFISDYSKNNSSNYNIQSFQTTSSLVNIAGAIGMLPISIWGGGALTFSKETATLLRTLKIPLNASSTSATSGAFLTYKLGKNNGYFQNYGVSQTVNEVPTKLMRQPNMQ